MDIPILQLFKKSPFKPLRQHMERAEECVSYLPKLFDCLKNEDYDGLQGIADEIFKLEHKADIIKNEIRDNLPRKLFLPVDRTDFLLYLSDQDALPDKVEDIAVLLTLKKLKTPEEIREGVSELVERTLHCAKIAASLTYKIDNILESSFGWKETQKVLKMVDELDYAEWRADKKQYEIARIVLTLENKLSPVECILWFNILKELGELANHCEKLGKRLRLMLART